MCGRDYDKDILQIPVSLLDFKKYMRQWISMDPSDVMLERHPSSEQLLKKQEQQRHTFNRLQQTDYEMHPPQRFSELRNGSRKRIRNRVHLHTGYDTVAARGSGPTSLRMSSASSPYSRPAPTRITCVDNRTNRRAKIYEVSNGKIKIASFKTTTISALSDGVRAFIAPVDGDSPLFETRKAYIIKNYTLSQKFGRECIFLNPNSRKFQTASFELPEEAERSARYLLNPPTVLMSGEEHDLFTRGGFISLKGQIEKMQVPRMTRVGVGEVPIRDLSLRCGQKLLDVSLWRDEALVELSLGDHVEISFLRATLRPAAKLNTSSYSAVEKTAAEPV
ncbi:uncharacterized protein LOC120494826 [Pimephales promelas]|uniref:uncharacterized protein LOC120494826 n=1 Tax=Pimephales promelas TaxID=90988 RepID=UPI0019558023|nr:uncharacterized protein LOC120494826 [Pimephales promelas]